MRFYLTILFVFAFLIIAFLPACINEKAGKKQEEAAAPQDLASVPIFQGKNLLDDKDISLEDFKGHVLIINFWATWCGPCRKEIPGFIELQDKYKDKKFSIIGMSVDMASELVVKNFVNASDINYPIIIIGRELQQEFEKAMGQRIAGIPTSLIVNRDGKIAKIHVALKPKRVFEEDIQELL
jgi:thiol-disulfide isomerase/thioredoxin